MTKVTPSSKIVGDLAQFMVQNKLSTHDVYAQAESLSFPSSVVEYMQGLIGQPPGGFPEPLRTQIVKNKARYEERPGKDMKPLDFAKVKADLIAKYGPIVSECDVMSYVMFPKVLEEFLEFKIKYGPVDTLDTRVFFVGPNIAESLEVIMKAFYWWLFVYWGWELYSSAACIKRWFMLIVWNRDREIGMLTRFHYLLTRFSSKHSFLVSIKVVCLLGFCHCLLDLYLCLLDFAIAY